MYPIKKLSNAIKEILDDWIDELVEQVETERKDSRKKRMQEIQQQEQ